MCQVSRTRPKDPASRNATPIHPLVTLVLTWQSRPVASAMALVNPLCRRSPPETQGSSDIISATSARPIRQAASQQGVVCATAHPPGTHGSSDIFSATSARPTRRAANFSWGRRLTCYHVTSCSRRQASTTHSGDDVPFCEVDELVDQAVDQPLSILAYSTTSTIAEALCNP